MVARLMVCVLLVVGFLTASGLAAEQVTNSIGLILVEVPAGEFMMGSRESLDEIDAAFPTNNYKKKLTSGDLGIDEWPRHKVRITKPFLLGKTEVTIGQFRKFVDDSGYKTEAEADGTGGWGVSAETGRFTGRKPEFNWKNSGFPQTDEHPVINVTWADADAFCRWLSKKEGKLYRLPAEAQWEYACRAGTEGRYITGDDPEKLVAFANLADASGIKKFPNWLPEVLKGDDGSTYTAKVGSYKPNAFGLHDMHGNVWEWCRDWYDEKFYEHSPSEDPECTKESEVRVRRGGAWHTAPIYVRSSFRNWNDPKSRYINLGFRVVQD